MIYWQNEFVHFYFRVNVQNDEILDFSSIEIFLFICSKISSIALILTMGKMVKF